MTGYDIYRRATVLLGADEPCGTENSEIAVSAALEAVNQIGNDLFLMTPLENIFDEITADEYTLGVMVYGVAMMLALTAGATEKNRLFCEIYNSKRAAVKSKTEKLKDVLPVSEEGY